MITEVTAYKLSDGRLITCRTEAAREEARIKLGELFKAEVGACPTLASILINNAEEVCSLLKEIKNGP